ncbi:MAG TPA: hypothetical protein VMA31_04795 [Bryobacteraceae bacterium]|nr:hypothetical protein [Bryobacteraceae bacterium]
MPAPAISLGETIWTLPPLILHPFNERVSPCMLLENSKAALMLSGLIPNDGTEEEELRRRLLSGRYSEARMLFYVGKDVFRWIGQCTESMARIPELDAVQFQPQSFARLLTLHTPASVKEKLTRWGVIDYRAIFSRAIGLNAMFCEPPMPDSLSAEFLRNYHLYTDALFRTYLESQPHPLITAANFHFELYASGEYSQMLEEQWAEPEI